MDPTFWGSIGKIAVENSIKKCYVHLTEEMRKIYLDEYGNPSTEHWNWY